MNVSTFRKLLVILVLERNYWIFTLAPPDPPTPTCSVPCTVDPWWLPHCLPCPGASGWFGSWEAVSGDWRMWGVWFFYFLSSSQDWLLQVGFISTEGNTPCLWVLLGSESLRATLSPCTCSSCYSWSQGRFKFFFFILWFQMCLYKTLFNNNLLLKILKIKEI